MEGKMNIINDIREKQNQLITMVNATFDELVKKVEASQLEGNEYEIEYESVYPITNTTGFKGKKPIAVKIANKRMTTPTWKIVVEKILKEVLKEKEMEDRLMALRDKILGRKRTRVSSNSTTMRSPLELNEELYIETHYDTETLMNFLIQILSEIHYDYNNIEIVIKN
jgi:hypothetical protein